MDAKINFTVYQVGRGCIRDTYKFTLAADTTMRELYDLIAEKDYESDQRLIGATIRAYDPSRIGYYDYPSHVFVSDDPDAKPTFQLDKSSAKRTIAECGITNGAKLMYENGEMD